MAFPVCEVGLLIPCSLGKAVAETLDEQTIPYKIVEKSHTLTINKENYICGNAADIDILNKAGIMSARSVIITTHNDDMNIYLTIYCRQLRPDVQIICRANNVRTVSKLYRAGADLVMSYASMASNSIINLLNPEQVLMIVEGLSIFRASVPHYFVGKSLSENEIRAITGCSVVAITREKNQILNPDPFIPLKENDELTLIGTVEAEKHFKEKYLASASVRYDGSSNFGADNRWGLFYSGSLGWNIAKEDFWDDQDKATQLLKERTRISELIDECESIYKEVEEVLIQLENAEVDIIQVKTMRKWKALELSHEMKPQMDYNIVLVKYMTKGEKRTVIIDRNLVPIRYDYLERME